ncbi:MAG: cysteine desulfurase NifS [Eubacterium sp.]|nr:cysteine desulfurase NifS [Eubacterium sp.]
MEKLIYLDNAATTALKPEVFEAMKPFFLENYSNPNSIYTFAQQSKKAVDEARETIAALIGAKPNEIYFTAGGSESDNWAIKGCAEAFASKGKHMITTKIEHHAVLHTCEYLEKKGVEVTYLDVDADGMISLEQLEQAIRPDTFLISIMFANNEIGTIEPVREIGAIAKKHGVLFHTDAVQAFGHVPVQVDELNIDMLSASAHKFHGPKGVGFFYMRNSVKLGAYLHGGAQERSRRAGTSNVPGIVGMAKAAQLAVDGMEKHSKKIAAVRDHLIERVLAEVPFSKLNGHREQRLPNNANFCFRFIEGESLLIMLDQKGICASSGSACTSGSLDPSHVLLAIGLPHEIAHGSLRLTLSEETTMEDVDFAADSLKAIVERLRSMSPLYEDFVKNQQHV